MAGVLVGEPLPLEQPPLMGEALPGEPLAEEPPLLVPTLCDALQLPWRCVPSFSSAQLLQAMCLDCRRHYRHCYHLDTPSPPVPRLVQKQGPRRPAPL